MCQPLSEQKRKSLKKYAATASIVTAFLLFLLKTFAALATGSLAILSSLVDSLSDIAASLVSYAAVRISSKPVSCTHRYGYFKAEHLSALIQAAFIAGSGVFVLYGGIERFLNPFSVKQAGVGIVVMVLSLAMTFFLVMFQSYVAKRTGSMAIKADSGHYISDFLSNGAVILSLLAVRFFEAYWVDTLTAVLIAVYLIFYAYKIAREATDSLMDRELSDEVRQKVLSAALKTEGVKGVHDMRTRDLGGVYYFELHLEMDGNILLCKAHEICDRAEEEIKKIYPDAQILIHQDPFGLKEDRLDDFLAHCLI